MKTLGTSRVFRVFQKVLRVYRFRSELLETNLYPSKPLEDFALNIIGRLFHLLDNNRESMETPYELVRNLWKSLVF